SVTTVTGPGTVLTVVPNVIVEKSTKSAAGGTTVKTTTLPSTFHTENSSSVEQSTERQCMDKSDSSLVTILPVLEVIQDAGGTSKCVCNSTDPSAQDPEEQRVNMLSMAVLGLRVLLAKGIAFNTQGMKTGGTQRRAGKNVNQQHKGLEEAGAELLTETTQDTRQHLPLKTLNTVHSCLASWFTLKTFKCFC
ncbi:hypothetical protein DV515_00017813, partial [Chloebia gouldiae]